MIGGRKNTSMSEACTVDRVRKTGSGLAGSDLFTFGIFAENA